MVFNSKPRSVRAVLVLFALCIVLPAVLAIGGMVIWNVSQVRNAQEAALLAVARTGSRSVDLKMTRLSTAAIAIATSDPVARRDWQGARSRFAEFELGRSTWLVVTDSSGSRLLNTALDVAPDKSHGLPRPDNVLTALRQGAPAISDLFVGTSTGRQVVAIDAAAPADPDEIVVSVVVDPASLLPAPSELKLPADSFATIVDRKKRVVARSRDHARWQGSSATPNLIAAMQSRPEGVISSRSLDGKPTVVAYSRSNFTGWTTIVVMPRARFLEPVWRNAAAFGFLSGLLLLLGIWLSRTFGRSLVKELHLLEEDAEHLGEGRVVKPRTSRIENVGRVQEALSEASLELNRRESRQALMINELNHRVKNTLATVQGLAAQTFREGNPGAPAKFDQRLVALAQAHDLLTRTAWESVDISAVIARCADAVEDSLVASGPPALLPPHAALALCMCVHELVTNSVKYGALSSDQGRVIVTWNCPAEGEIDLLWREEGGPPVTPPARSGFGSRLIDRLARTELGGEIERDYAPSGLIFRGRFKPAARERFRNSFD